MSLLGNWHNYYNRGKLILLFLWNSIWLVSRKPHRTLQSVKQFQPEARNWQCHSISSVNTLHVCGCAHACVCVSICRKTNEITLGIHRKSTYMDTVIPSSSKARNHKMTPFNYMLDTAHRLPITSKNIDNEAKQTSITAKNNRFSITETIKSYSKQKISISVNNTDVIPMETEKQ